MLRNGIGKEGAEAIVSVAKDKLQLTTLCGFKPEQTEANLSNRHLDANDAILPAFDLQKNSVLVKLECAIACFWSLAVSSR